MPPTLSAAERRVWRVIGIALAQLRERDQASMRRPLVEVGLTLRDGEEVDELFVAGQLGVLALTNSRLVLARRTLRDFLRRRVRIESIAYDRVTYVDRNPPGEPAAAVVIGSESGSTIIALDNRAAADRLVSALAPRVTPEPGALDKARLRRKERRERIERIATIPISAAMSAASAAGLAWFDVLSLSHAIWFGVFLWLFQLLLLVAKTKRDDAYAPDARTSAPPLDARLWL